MLVLTSDAFADWFDALSDQDSEDVATMLDVVEKLGPNKSPPESRESLLWYEHPSVANFQHATALAWDLEAWGTFRDYAKQVLTALDAPRFAARLTTLAPNEARVALDAIKEIRKAADPRLRWTLKLLGDPFGVAPRVQPSTACDEIRRLYFEALGAAGFDVRDVPAHSLALRELSRRVPSPAFRLLYGVDAPRDRALVVLGEFLDRSFYGNSVRRAERMWKAFLEGDLHTFELGH